MSKNTQTTKNGESEVVIIIQMTKFKNDIIEQLDSEKKSHTGGAQ